MITLWFVFANQRWSIKIIAPLLGLIGTTGLALLVFRGDRRSIWELLVGAVGVIAILSLTLGLARRRGWRLIQVGKHSSQPTVLKVETRMPLRDIFLVIAAVSGLFAVVRFVPASQLERQVAGMLALLAVTTGTVAILGAWGALTQRHAMLRITALVLAIACAGSIHSLLFPTLYNWFAWIWHIRFAAMVTVFTCASLLIFRARGWRLVQLNLQQHRIDGQSTIDRHSIA
jgi:hypothetical protein